MDKLPEQISADPTLGGPGAVDAPPSDSTPPGEGRFFWSRKSPAAPRQRGIDLRRDYEEIVRECWTRYGVGEEEYRVEAIARGNHNGKTIYVVMLASTKETIEAAIQLQCIAPIIEKRVAESVNARWLGDYSVFAGVWTRWPSQLRVPDQFRILLHSLRQEPRNPAPASA